MTAKRQAVVNTLPCAHCGVDGTVAQDVFPYSIAPSVIAWLHRACRESYYAAHRSDA